MQIFEDMLLNGMCLLFPLSIYIIFIAYFRNQDKHSEEIFLVIALYSSIYLLMKFGSDRIFIYPMILFNVPLLVAYLKRKNKVAIIISIILVFYYHYVMKVEFIHLVLEYILYYITYNYLSFKRKDSISIITNFVVIKSFLMSLELFFIFNPTGSSMENVVLIIFIMTYFTLIAYLILFFINKGEEVMMLNNVIHELEKEKKLRESLFKITHEIKNPIAVCKGYLDMLDYDDKDKVKRYIPIIKDEISRTLILMDDFLDYTKVEIELDIADIYMLLEDTCDIVKPLFKNNHMKLNYSIPDDELYMNLDYNRLKQVLVNILKNSIEAKDNRKKENMVTIDVIAEKEELVIKIRDNGVGMDKKTLEKVDEMFYTTKEKGTGLGVALSKEIINLHGGNMKYSSIKGKYTQVVISLPIIA